MAHANEFHKKVDRLEALVRELRSEVSETVTSTRGETTTHVAFCQESISSIPDWP